MDPARQKRREQIKQSLKFIRSSLPYPEPEAYQDFLTQLVCNLLDEGNALFREREWVKAVCEFDEGLNVSSYAAADDFHISEVLLESLYVSRAAAYYSMGDYDEGIKDCDSALEVCKESCRALYRKAVCLKELGKYKEAYNCTTDCLLISRLDKQVNELAQELAIQLGLKNRKPYISTKEDTLITRDVTNVNMTAEATKEPDHLGNGVTPLSGLAPVPDTLDTCEDSELMGDDIDNLLDCFPADLESAETAPERNIWHLAHIQAAFPVPSRTSICTPTAPSVLPPPTPQLPPAFFSSAVSKINSLDFFSGGRSATAAMLDSLDDLSTSGGGVNGGAPILGLGSVELDALDGLDALDDFPDTTPSSAKYESKTNPEARERSFALLDDLDPLETITDPYGLFGDVPKFDVKAVGQRDSLDALDFLTVEGVGTGLPAVSIGKGGLDSLSDFSSNGIPASHNAAAPVIRSPKNNHKEKNNQAHVTVANPLSSTHDFLQACSTCYPRKGQGIYSFVHKPELIHSCKRDILLCRRKVGHRSEWTRVRPIPKRTSFSGPFVLCNEIVKSGDLGLCKYGEECTFAYNQLEIDVWTEERKGTLDRHLLFETAAVKLDPVISIIRLLQEHKGMFIFLCQECYDHKPRIFSKRCKDRHTMCSNLDARHNFDANKCLAFTVKNPSTNYSKVRPLRLLCNFDLCRQAVRDSCQREDSCDYAHSVIELKTWRVQRDTGINPGEIVKVSTKYYEKQEQDFCKHKGNRLFSGDGGSKPKGAGGGVGKSLNMRMMFACAQCWRDGLNSEPDKALKYCTAKARHTWTKDRCLLLVNSSERSKWVAVRPLPHAKNFPAHYDICTQILEKRKCNFTGKCTFAHSQEEREMWTYMKNNGLVEMQQVYDTWLTSRTHNRRAGGATLNQTVPEEVQKYIVMPTDYAEPTSGFHCHLCGKHSNSERQWQQHISSEKHKDRVFNCEGEDEALTWNYRFPGTCFNLCPKLDGCPDGVSCDYAHSPEELHEWTERRDFLRQKLAKAREDMLIMPDEFDFGKYNYLLQD